MSCSGGCWKLVAHGGIGDLVMLAKKAKEADVVAKVRKLAQHGCKVSS